MFNYGYQINALLYLPLNTKVQVWKWESGFKFHFNAAILQMYFGNITTEINRKCLPINEWIKNVLFRKPRLAVCLLSEQLVLNIPLSSRSGVSLSVVLKMDTQLGPALCPWCWEENTQSAGFISTVFPLLRGCSLCRGLLLNAPA